jgi:hypothetical protein
VTVTTNTTWYCNYGNGSSTGYYAVAQWATNTAYTVGQIIRQKTTPAVNSERCFVVITAGTSSATTEPTWSTSKGSKTTDAGGPVYMECTGLAALNADSTNVPLSSQNRSGSQSLGNLVQNNTNTHYFICTTAGSTGASEPTFTTTTGGTTTDSGCTWTCLGAISSFTTKWGAPWARIGLSGSFWQALGDTIYVSSSHAESTTSNGNNVSSSNLVNSGSVTKFICVSNGGNIPPQSGDVTTGATHTQTTAFSNTALSGALYVVGIAFTTNGTGAGYTFLNGGGYQRFVNCAFNMQASSGQPTCNIGSVSVYGRVIWENTTVQFTGLSGQSTPPLSFGNNLIWRNTPSALSKNGSNWPNSLFGSPANAAGTILIENVDLSAFAGTQLFNTSQGQEGIAKWVFNRCKLPSVTFQSGVYSFYHEGWTVDLIDTDTGGNTYRHDRYCHEGQHTISTSAVYTGGATNGTTAYSWQVATTANAQWIVPFECLPMAIWNTTTGANRTVTVQGIYNGAALPNNDQIWIDVTYFGTASSTLGTSITGTKSNYLASGSASTANTSAVWNSAATARANSTAYSLGNLISVATAATGQLYICTTAGTSSGSIPGGYASCSDGSTVTDGTAVFRAMMRFQMSVTMSSPQPQSAGYFNIYVKTALASSTFFVDPAPVLS